MLGQGGLEDEHAGHVCKLYTENMAAIRRALSKVGFKFPEVVGMSWRLDYTLRSSTVGKMQKQLFLITLHTMHPGGTATDVTFTCSQEQLRELQAKVDDAVKQVDRLRGAGRR